MLETIQLCAKSLKKQLHKKYRYKYTMNTIP